MTVDTGGEFPRAIGWAHSVWHVRAAKLNLNESRGISMSLQPKAVYPIPEETRRTAHAAFPKGTLCLRIADELGSIYSDQQFINLFPCRGQPGVSPARLALTTILQFVDGMSDRQAAEAVRGRIDWKYALGLELTDPGFDHSVLSEFRSRLINGQVEAQLLDTLLTKLRERNLLKARGRQRTDSTHVLAAVRWLNRLERVGETLRATLESIAVVAPDWLRAQALPEWYERYGSRIENYHLPKTDSARQEWAEMVGVDGHRLLQVIDESIEMGWLKEVPAVRILRRVWIEHYNSVNDKVVMRKVEDMPSSDGQICSPYDTDARYSTKRTIEWVGYKAQLTETCDDGLPSLIVNVETTPATTPDDNILSIVHESLKMRDLLPSQHLVDKGYTDSHVLVDSKREYGVEVIGPVAADPSWQARAGKGFDKSKFIVDWDNNVITCPSGKKSISWQTNTYPKNGMKWEVRFSRRDCTPCPFRGNCTKAKIEPRIITLQPREYYEALQAGRKRQDTEEFREQYAPRAGIEATHEQCIRRCGLRQSRYIGLVKTHFQHFITAAAINLIRINDWWCGLQPACTRRSRFIALQLPAVNMA